jgi:hypothetical protein
MFRPQAVIGCVEIPQRSSPSLHVSVQKHREVAGNEPREFQYAGTELTLVPPLMVATFRCKSRSKAA